MLAFARGGKFIRVPIVRSGNMQRCVTQSTRQKRGARQPEERNSRVKTGVFLQAVPSLLRRSGIKNVDVAESHDSTDSSAQKLRYSEKKGDLFTCDSSTSLAHCVSADMAMGKGIACLFKKKFGGVEELKKQRKTVGEVAVLKRENRFVYYLVTKSRFFHKPTYDTLQKSLQAMKCHCVENNVFDVAMPQIGCGLDRLEWNLVSQMIKDTFKDLDMTITVYYL